MKTHFTRKNLISIGLVFFYLLFAFISALLIDASNPIGIRPSANVVQKIGLALGFPKFVGSIGAWVLISLILVNILLFTVAFIFEFRLSKAYEQPSFSLKWIGIYTLTFLVCFGVAFGIGMIAQYPYDSEYMSNSVLFLFESLILGLILFILAFILIGGICLLVINLKNINKPFKFFDNDEADEEEIEEVKKDNTDEQSLATSFSGVKENDLTISSHITNEEPSIKFGTKEDVFPGLSTIDVVEQANREETFSDDISLTNLCNRFRNYLAKEEKLYFSIDTIRAFISGMSVSHLIILEGLSGTGKSSLARYFSEFINENSYFEPVQATWRDRTSILGYYNDFSRKYDETEFLKRLYQANYRQNHINVMVLDEINISRIEYYFADFLSILEYPKDKWQLKIMQLPYDFEAPEKLEEGFLKIPENTWFIGTANKDDSTYAITDKVYDRAITISFDDKNIPFEVTEDGSKIDISYSYLNELFEEAQNNDDYKLTDKDCSNFKLLTDFVNNTFDITFGNRIYNQIELLVPTYFACGGKKEEALDFMFARKIVSKLSGRFEDYIKPGLIDLNKLITKVYGENSFTYTREEIDKLIRKL